MNSSAIIKHALFLGTRKYSSIIHPGAYAVMQASNRLVFGNAASDSAEATLQAVEPAEPVTSGNKASTYARNAAWFASHARDRRTLLVLGDRIEDLRMGEGARAAGYSCVGVGIRNDEPDGVEYPDHAAYAAAFDDLVLGDEGSLGPLAEAIVGLPA